MTVSTIATPIYSACDGVTTAFPITWSFQLATDVLVQKLTIATQAITTLVLGVDYTITGGGSPAAPGTMTTVSTYPVGVAVIMTLAPPVTQLTAWQSNDAYPGNSQRIENALDKLTMLLGGLNYNFGRSWYLRPQDVDGSGAFDARGNRGTNLGVPTGGSDAVTLGYMQSYIATLITTGLAGAPQEWFFSGDGVTQTFPIVGATVPFANAYYVFLNGVYQKPLSDYTVSMTTTPPSISFLVPPPNLVLCDVRATGFAVPILNGIDGSAITTGLVNPARLGTGAASASTFLNGASQWVNTLIGSAGDATVGPDAQSVFTAQQLGAAAIRVIAGNGSPSAIRFGHGTSVNAWDAQWVFDPVVNTLGWQGFGGPTLGTFNSVTGDVSFGTGGFYFQRSTGRVGIGTNAPAFTLDVNGNINASGQITGNAAGSLINSGQVLPQFLGSNTPAANLVLYGDGIWRPSTGGSGGGTLTTTTGTFVVAAVSSSQTVPVTSATGITIGAYIYVSDSAHTIIGQVTNVVALNLTVTTVSILAGIAGNTMASGATVGLAGAPGQNTVLTSDGTISATTTSAFVYTGNAVSGAAGVNNTVNLWVSNVSGGTLTVKGYVQNVPYNTLRFSVSGATGPTAGNGGVLGFTNASGLPVAFIPTLGGNFGVLAAATTSPFDPVFRQILHNDIQPGGVDAIHMFATNSPTAGGLVFVSGVGASAQGTWTAMPAALPSGGTSANWLRGDSTFSAFLVGPVGTTDPAHTTATATIAAINDGTNQIVQLQQQNSGSAIHTRYWSIDGPHLVGNNIITSTAGAIIDGSLVEYSYVAGLSRATGFRSLYGPLQQIITTNNPTGTVTLDLVNGNYVRFTGTVSNTLTIALADSTPVPSSLTYAQDLTIEFPAVVSQPTWPNSTVIDWVNGGSTPTLSTTTPTIVKLTRRQGVTKWIGSVPLSTVSAYTDNAARNAVFTTSQFPSSSSITATVTTGVAGNVVYTIPTSGVTNAMLAGGIAATKLSGYPADGTKFLNGLGVWAVPAGGSTTLYQLQANAVNVGTPTSFTTLNFDSYFTVTNAAPTATLHPNLSLLQQGIQFGIGVGGVTSSLPNGDVITINPGPGVTFAQSGTSGVRTVTISAASGSFSPATSYSWTAPQTWNGRHVYNAVSYPGTFPVSASGSVMIHDYYPNDAMSPTIAAALKINTIDNDTSANFEAFDVFNVKSAATALGTQCVKFWHATRGNFSNGFAITHQVVAESSRLTSANAAADAVWLNSWSPTSRYSASADANGITHRFDGGTVRIGELNYGNAWADFGYIDDRGISSHVVCGLEFFPAWLQGTTGDNIGFQYHASWAIAIGFANANPGSPSTNQPKNWTGILFCKDGIVPGGLNINAHGGSTSGNATAAAINIQDHHKTGINFAGTAGGAPGGNAATIEPETVSGHSNQPAITLAQGQAVCFKPPTGANTGVFVWFDGTNLRCTKDGGNTSTILV